jgi:hypothetical protein
LSEIRHGASNNLKDKYKVGPVLRNGFGIGGRIPVIGLRTLPLGVALHDQKRSCFSSCSLDFSALAGLNKSGEGS